MTRPLDRTGPDKPLTDAQERLLIALDEAGVEWRAVGSLRCSIVDGGRFRGRTARRLHELRLVEVRSVHPGSRHEIRISDAGRAMLRSMGD